MKLLTMTEAAHFLRMSRSSLYQRKDIPRYRRPGSRVMLFDQYELETWMKQGRMVMEDQPVSPITAVDVASATEKGAVDISAPHVYHRSTRYR